MKDNEMETMIYGDNEGKTREIMRLMCTDYTCMTNTPGAHRRQLGHMRNSWCTQNTVSTRKIQLVHMKNSWYTHNTVNTHIKQLVHMKKQVMYVENTGDVHETHEDQGKKKKKKKKKNQ